MSSSKTPHPLYTTKDPDKVRLNVAALSWLVLYVLALIIVFGANLAAAPKDDFMKRAGQPVDAVEMKKHLVISKWDWA